MKKHLSMTMVALCFVAVGMAQNVTLRVKDRPAAEVFRSLIEQTGKNFVYSSELLENVKVSVSATNKPLKNVLDEMFSGTGIEYKIKGKNVVLKRSQKKGRDKKRKIKHNVSSLTIKTDVSNSEIPTMLEEVVIVSRLESPIVETAEIGAKKVTADEVRNTPSLFGENDVIKALQMQPGVSDGTEGMAGMHVHGGNNDENLYMLDNVPIYQVNHFAGLFSAFNTDLIRYIDFFKSSFPAKYDGRLSSFMDVRLMNGNQEGHHGSARLGLTSGAFNISGPIGSRTTYLVGLRRSWYDVLTIPILAIINKSQDEKVRFRYHFMDFNANISHRFNNNANIFLKVYFGNDKIEGGMEDKNDVSVLGWKDNERNDFHWGNFVAQTGMNYRFNSQLSAEFTAAYTRFFSSLKYRDYTEYYNDGIISTTNETIKTANNINDWIFRGDFDWQPTDRSRVRFGASYVLHSFLPLMTTRNFKVDNLHVESRDSTWAYHANEFNLYIEDDWRINDKIRVNAGVHGSLFHIDGRLKHGLSPRLSVAYRPGENWAVKFAYSHNVQYVHQLTQSYLALPTDQWVPVTRQFKPQTADKIAAGVYWQSDSRCFAISAEGYYKWMHNLLDYSDEYYLKPPLETWNARLTSGQGTSKGVDLKIEKLSGKITGHISYSLAWADRTFADKNDGLTFPARFDNRHTINVLVNWHINDKVQLNASWTGHSGNRFTLLPQMWEIPWFGYIHLGDEVPLRTHINNYQLPFYHRLDLSCTVKNSRGYWTFGLYNAYNHMNTIAIKHGYKDEMKVTPTGYTYTSRPVFQKVKLLPIIPSISYTWQF